MNLKDLNRETLNAERLAELGRLVLGANDQIVKLQDENKVLAGENEKLKAEIKQLKAARKETCDAD